MKPQLLKNRIKEKGWNVETLAKKIGISRSNLYRKLNFDVSTTIGEALKIKDALNLTDEEARSIFFD